MRILIVANGPWVSSGYGVQARLMMQQFPELGHEVGIVAHYGLEGAATKIGECVIYPGGREPFGQDVIAPHAEHFRADVVVTLIDAWVYRPATFGGLCWAPYFPIDCEPMPDPVRVPVSTSYQPIVMSRFGERMAQDKGLSVRYAPHSFDASVYHPVDKREARLAQKWPQDRWIVGMIAKNSSNTDRKALAPQIAGFAAFKKRHPDALLYLHTDLADPRGVNLHPLLEHLGLEHERDYIVESEYAHLIGVDDAIMRQIYGGLDLLMSVSMGEGFGVPILEAQAAGRPVLVGDWTAMGELCRSGWKLQKTAAEPYWYPIGAWQWKVREAEITEALEVAYRDAGTFAPAEIAARVQDYEAKTVADQHWRPILTELADRLGERKRLRQGGTLVAAGLP